MTSRWAEAAPSQAVSSRGKSSRGGLWLGALGVLLFSMSLPATRVAVAAFDPVFVAAGRGVGAGLLAALVLGVSRAPWPTMREWRWLAVVSAGVVLGFPILTSIAMRQAEAIHGAVVTGLLPAATAVAAVLLTRERPSIRFWLAALAGFGCVVAFAVVQGAGRLDAADGLLLLAVVLCAAGYAAGAVLTRTMGGTRVIGWALVLALPVTVPMLALHWDGPGVTRAPARAWAAFAYVMVVSQYLGFFAWYAGLARGGVARVAQVMLAQPVLSMVWAVLLLGEVVTAPAVVAAGLVLVCVVVTQRAR